MQSSSNGLPARALTMGLGFALAFSFSVAAAAADRAPSHATAPLASASASSATVGQVAGLVGNDTCLTCHEGQKAIEKTPHGKVQNPRTPFAAQGCETCHGPGQKHVDSGKKEDIRRFPAMDARDVSEVCTTCHNRSTHAFWKGSPHDSRNMSCVTCHSVHSPESPKAQLKKASDLDLCGTCHKTQALKVRRTSHMPVVEGKMSCTSCHNPHGSANVKNLKTGNSVNEACISCHSEKRGPFLFEHEPVRENCTTCHDPHGSSNDRMLVAKAPMLCQRCHVTTRHPPTIYDGNNVKNIATASNRVYGRSCVNCHSNIHGSNSPSGNAFLR